MNATDPNLSPAIWMHRASAFELLALAFLVPTDALAEAYASGEYAEACAEAFETALPADERVGHAVELLVQPAAPEGATASDVLSLLRREHTRLFIGEREPLITPFAGVWATQRQGGRGLLFVGEESVAIERAMKRCGITKNLGAGQTNDPLDHIGTLCEFLMYLCLIQAKAIQAPEGARVEKDDFGQFMEQHFAPFAFWLAKETERQTRLPFFQGAALLLAVAADLAPTTRKTAE